MLKNVKNTTIANSLTPVDTDVKIENVNKVKQLSVDDITIKQENDIDLVEIVREMIETKMGSEASLYFLKDPIVETAKGLPSITQRVILNRFFIQTLIRARAYLDLENSTFILGSIKLDGTHQTWLRAIEDIVVPYFQTNSILQLFIDRIKLVMTKNQE